MIRCNKKPRFDGYSRTLFEVQYQNGQDHLTIDTNTNLHETL